MADNIKAVLFDLDGVLVNSPLDLAAIKRELFGDTSVYIIEGLDKLPPEQREEKSRILLERELEAAGESELCDGVREIFGWLDSNRIKRGVVTRNARDVVSLIKDRHQVDFGAVVAREDAPPKPDPACIYRACKLLDVTPSESVMVGDFSFDIEAGINAGCRTVFVETDNFRHLETGENARIKSLTELRDVIMSWMQ